MTPPDVERIMGQNRLFIPQDVLDQLVDDGKAELESNRLILEGEGTFTLQPASHFLREATGAEDPNDLVGRVKDQGAIDELGVEAYMDSAIFGDNAYDISPGFVATPEAAPVAEGPAEAESAEEEPEPAEAESAEEEPEGKADASGTAQADAEREAEKPLKRSKSEKSGKADSDELAELLLKHLK